jgi:hypothetical protein
MTGRVNHQRIKGFCPACGGATLYRRQRDSQIVCSEFSCAEPLAAHQILADRMTDHVVQFHPGQGFSIWHPLRERIDRRILVCDLHAWLEDHRPSEADRPGQYRAAEHGPYWVFLPLELEVRDDDVYPGS